MATGSKSAILTLFVALAIFITASPSNVVAEEDEYEVNESLENFGEDEEEYEEDEEEYVDYEYEFEDDEDEIRKGKKKKNQTDNKPVSQINANVGAGSINIPLGNNSETGNQGALNVHTPAGDARR